jgi:hypothetical protein
MVKVDFHHRLHRDGATIRIEHEVTMSGPLTFLFKRIIGTKLAHGLPAAVAALAQQSEAITRQ